MQELINNAHSVGRGDALVDVAKIADQYIYSSLAPHVVEMVPVDTGALAASLSAPDAPGAIHTGVIGADQVVIDYGTSMDSELRYDVYGPGKTGNSSGPYPYYYPAEVEDKHHFMAEGRRYFREVLHASAIANMSKAIIRKLKR